MDKKKKLIDEVVTINGENVECAGIEVPTTGEELEKVADSILARIKSEKADPIAIAVFFKAFGTLADLVTKSPEMVEAVTRCLATGYNHVGGGLVKFVGESSRTSYAKCKAYNDEVKALKIKYADEAEKTTVSPYIAVTVRRKKGE